MLSQEDQGLKRVVAYASRKLHKRKIVAGQKKKLSYLYEQYNTSDPISVVKQRFASESRQFLVLKR